MSTDELSRRLDAALGELCFPNPFEDGAPNGHIHPCIASHGKAGHLTDTSGVEYIDYHSSWGTNILGYGYPRVVEMVQAQLRAGSPLGLPNIPFIEVAELLREMIPCAEKVAFAKNGSDATEGAVRLARTVTGRERILTCGFHGFHDWYMASIGECRGIPSCLRRLVDRIPYNDLAGADRKFREVPDSIAAVIIDPVSVPLPELGFLTGLVELAHRHGALAIFDEVVTGFRLAPGGAQQYYGVKPDLACFGKAIANGASLSALVGKKKYMQYLPYTKFAMTYAAEALSLAAAKATLSEIRDKDVCGALWEKGAILQREYRRIAVEQGVRTEIAGNAPRCKFQFDDQRGISERELRWLLIQELARVRIFTTGILMVCYSHNDEDIQRTVAAFSKAMAVVRTAIDRGTVDGLLNPGLCTSMKMPPVPFPGEIRRDERAYSSCRARLRTALKDALPHGLVRTIQARKARLLGKI